MNQLADRYDEVESSMIELTCWYDELAELALSIRSLFSKYGSLKARDKLKLISLQERRRLLIERIISQTY